MKTVFITGISSGIGLDASKKLLAQGYKVIGSVRKPEDKEKLLESYPSNLEIMLFDVTDYEAVKNEFKALNKRNPSLKIDILINNAGIAVPGPLAYLENNSFEKQITVNVSAVRNMINICLPYLGFPDQNKSENRKIINISSISGIFNAPFNGAYCISKHALESMTDIYRRELLPYGIDVISIQPGPIKTKIWKKNIGQLDRFLDTPYASILKKANKMIEDSEKGALPVEKISQLILDIIENPKPKTRYLVHKKKLLFRLLANFAPDRFVDRLIWKNLKKNDKYRPV